MNITGHEVEKLKDPTGILEGERYEFILDIEVPEDDELFSDNGLYLKVIIAVDDNDTRVAQYNLFEENSSKLLDFELEEEEISIVKEYCVKKLEDSINQ
ncbi:DUF6509 family protein [Sutcliffiella halmapala]|uniref:DUF6509 family protein n=1 Tax=Sutcliffiella halmapala TaxID=79882 RepID=UPI00099555DF|nr:DUF6509 family protein [Sutcliffiella halmapala]